MQCHFGAGEGMWGWKAMAGLYRGCRGSYGARGGMMGSWWPCSDAGGVIQGWGVVQRAVSISPDAGAAAHGVWVGARGGLRGRGWPWSGSRAPVVPTPLGPLTPSLLPTVQPVLRPPARPGGPCQRLPRQTREGRGVLLPLGGLCPPWQGLQCQVGRGAPGTRGVLWVSWGAALSHHGETGAQHRRPGGGGVYPVSPPLWGVRSWGAGRPYWPGCPCLPTP